MQICNYFGNVHPPLGPRPEPHGAGPGSEALRVSGVSGRQEGAGRQAHGLRPWFLGPKACGEIDMLKLCCGEMIFLA